jgi:hypothetical protein
MILKCLYTDTVDASFLSLDEKYSAGFVGADVLRTHAEQPEYDLSDSFQRRALAVDDECFAIRHADVLAAYGWYSTSANHFSDSLTLHFSPRWVYMYRGFTHPAYRGQRLHAIAMTLALRAYRARGFDGLTTCVEARNEASLKSCYRMGYRDFGTIYGLRLGRLLGLRHARGRLLNHELIYCTPGCRRFGFWLERTGDTTGAGRPLKV